MGVNSKAHQPAAHQLAQVDPAWAYVLGNFYLTPAGSTWASQYATRWCAPELTPLRCALMHHVDKPCFPLRPLELASHSLRYYMHLLLLEGAFILCEEYV